MTVLRLTDQIACDDGRIGRVVGDDRDLRRSCKHIDANLTEQCALGLGDVLVAGADDDAGWFSGE